MVESNENYKIPLGELFAVLKKGGYDASIQQVLEIEAVLLTSPVFKWNAEHLKFIVTPVLAKNEDEQEEIYHIIDAFIASKRISPSKKESSLTKLLHKKHLVFQGKIIAFILLVAFALFLYFFNEMNTASKKRLDLPIPEAIKTDTAKTLPIQENNNIPPPVDRPRQTYNSITPKYNGKPIAAERASIILQISAAFGFGLGAMLYYLVFFDNRKRMAFKSQSSGESEGFLENEKDSSSKLPGNANEAQSQSTIHFSEKNFLIEKSMAFTAIRTNLKKPFFVDHVELDIEKSAFATARNAGFPSLVYDDERRERKFILLFDNKNSNAHITQLLNFLAKFLISSKIPIAKYTYTDDVATLNDGQGNIIYLSDLVHHFPRHHLIVMGDGHSFFKPGSFEMKEELADIFGQWMSKSIITPLSLEDWSDAERQLQKAEFQVVPAEINAVKLLSRVIAENISLKRQDLERQVGDGYSVVDRDLNSIEQLKSYLNNETLFQLVCSLAVYPRLNWPLSLALFSEILRRKSERFPPAELNYETLLKISRIPWLNTGELDDHTRLMLFNQLDPEIELISRETILDLLREIKPSLDPRSRSFHEFDLQYKLNSFFLFAHDQDKYKQYADVKKSISTYWDNLPEKALKTRVESRVSGLMPENKEGQRATVNEFVLKEEEFDKLNVTFLRVVLLTVPAIVLYILFSLTKPNFVFTDYHRNVSFMVIINKEAACNKFHSIRISKRGSSYIRPLQPSTATEIIELNDVRHDTYVEMQFLPIDSGRVNFEVLAKDSVATVNLDCK